MSAQSNHSMMMFLEPSAAAKRLGVSASGLRRLAPLYESVHGELPRRGSGDESKRARLWPEEAVERLQDARKLVELERCRTISEGLRAIQSGINLDDLEVEPASSQIGLDIALRQTLGVLLERMQTLEVLPKQIRELQSEIAELRQELQQREQIALPKKDDEKKHGVFVRFALWIEERFRG